MRDVDGVLGDDAEARRLPVFQLGSISRARQVLRELSGGLGWRRVTWHGFRRGSATDLVAEGASLSKVLAWGAWRSAAFLRYISADALSRRQALDHTLAASESGDEGR